MTEGLNTWKAFSVFFYLQPVIYNDFFMANLKKAKIFKTRRAFYWVLDIPISNTLKLTI